MSWELSTHHPAVVTAGQHHAAHTDQHHPADQPGEEHCSAQHQAHQGPTAQWRMFSGQC